MHNLSLFAAKSDLPIIVELAFHNYWLTAKSDQPIIAERSFTTPQRGNALLGPSSADDNVPPRATMRWLAAERPQELLHTIEGSRQSIPMPPSLGSGSLEIATPALGVVFCQSKIQFEPGRKRRLAPIMEAAFETAGASLLIHTAHKGRVLIRNASTGEDHWLGAGTNVIQHGEDLRCSLLVDTAQDSVVTTLLIDDAALAAILGEDETAAFLKTVQGMGPNSICDISTPDYISRLLSSAFSSSLTGGGRNLYAQARALEFLCMLAEHVRCERSGSPDVRRSSLAHRIHDDVLSTDGKLPSLADLSRRYGVSAKTLNEAFRQEFGQTIGAYATEQRLNEAHAALLTSDIPMKVLAARLGYAHVNNFITAFKRRFGYAPGSLRRTGSTHHDRNAPFNCRDIRVPGNFCEFCAGRRCEVAGQAPCCRAGERQKTESAGTLPVPPGPISEQRAPGIETPQNSPLLRQGMLTTADCQNCRRHIYCRTIRGARRSAKICNPLRAR